jgi:DNA-binding LytR/AlgR family response regulator
MTGIDVARRIGGRAAVVFVAAPGEPALAAFVAGQVDHVVKPVDPQRLAPAVARVQARLAAPAAAPADLRALLAQLASQVRRPAPLEVIEARVGADGHLVRVDDVVYLESDGRHTRLVLGDGELLPRTPLKELIAQLDAKLFWQIHRCVIVNHRHIAGDVRVDEDNMVLTLRGRHERLPVSRHFQSLFRGQ